MLNSVYIAPSDYFQLIEREKQIDVLLTGVNANGGQGLKNRCVRGKISMVQSSLLVGGCDDK